MWVHGPTGASVVLVHAVLEDVVRAVAQQARRDRRPDERHQEQEDDEADARDRELVAPEADPDELPVAARLDRRDEAVGDVTSPPGSATGSPSALSRMLTGPVYSTIQRLPLSRMGREIRPKS